MPTYEYRCNSCAHEFEAFQSIMEDPITVCPRCGEDRVQRLISAGGGLIFKGSGFYITDYRKDSYQKDAKKEKPSVAADSKSSGKSGKTGESKSRSKSSD